MRFTIVERSLMADPLYFSVWFPNFDEADMLPRVISVMKQFPFSEQRPGITYLSVHPVSWNEATVLERRFTPGITPEEAATVASELLHEDYAYIFEAYWDLWILDPNQRQWSMQPTAVQFILQEAESLTLEGEDRIRINVQRLVEFTIKVEKNTGATGRLLWSDSEDNLAQKLISRLQRIQ